MTANSSGPIRGSRVGSSPVRTDSNVAGAPRFQVDYYCQEGHLTHAVFAKNAHGDVPVEWTCTHCGLPAGLDQQNPPKPQVSIPYKTHFDYVHERRSDEDGEKLLQEALDNLRQRRGLGHGRYKD